MAQATGRRSSNRRRRLAPAGKLLEMIAMRHVPQAIHAVAVLGIADLLAVGPKSSDELARATGSHARTLSRVLRTLVAAGIFAEDKAGHFHLTALGQPLRSDVADTVRAASIFLSGDSQLEGLLVDCVRTGKTAIELASGGTNWIEYFRQEPTRAAVFNAAMTALSKRALCRRRGGLRLPINPHARRCRRWARTAAVDDPGCLPENAWRALRPAARPRRRTNNDRRGGVGGSL